MAHSTCNWLLPAALTSLLALACGESGGANGTGVDAGAPPDAAAHAPADAGSPGLHGWITGYYVGYQRDLYPPESVYFEGITHLAIGGVVPRPDGTLDTTFFLDATQGPALARDLVARAHAAGRKAILMVGGAGSYGGFSSAVSLGNRATFVRNLVALLQDFGADGLDLDYEPIYDADKPLIRALALELRAARPGILLTIPVGWVNSNMPDVDPYWGQVSPLFDQINIMSYGMAGNWGGWDSWHGSALYGESASTPSSVDASVRAWLAAGVPAAKLGIGVGFYGSCWSEGVTGPRQVPGTSEVVADDNAMSFTNIMRDYFEAPARQWDSQAGVPYLSFSAPKGPEGCTFISYDDADSVAEKGRYLRQKGLGGAIVWTVNQGHLPDAPAGSRDPLLQALKAALE